MKRKIDIGRVERLIKEKFYNTKGHEVDVTGISLEREGHPVEVEYNYSINGVYQSTHDIKLTDEEVKRCYAGNYPRP